MPRLSAWRSAAGSTRANPTRCSSPASSAARRIRFRARSGCAVATAPRRRSRKASTWSSAFPATRRSSRWQASSRPSRPRMTPRRGGWSWSVSSPGATRRARLPTSMRKPRPSCARSSASTPRAWPATVRASGFSRKRRSSPVTRSSRCRRTRMARRCASAPTSPRPRSNACSRCRRMAMSRPRDR